MDNSLFEKVLRGEIPLESLEKADKLAFLDLLEEKEKRLDVTAGQTSLIEFAKQVYPNYSVGAHHRKMAKIFEDVAAGRKKRVIINIAPRHGKSELTSYLFPAWFLGQKPDAKIIMATHTASLSEQFGRRVRNLIDGEDYKRIFPETNLSSDSKSAGSWATSQHGQYYAVGVGGALAGRGADLLVIDDPHSEQDVKSGTGTVFEQAWSWYQTGPRQRLMWGGAIIVVMTRWSQLDLTGMLLEYQANNPDADQWEVIELPAILESKNEATGEITEKSLWPEKWPLEELQLARASMDPRYWNAQYMQNPTSDAVAVIKREQWREWPTTRPPHCDFILQTWDTAFEAKNSSDFSACTTWGIFTNEDENNESQVILLDAFKDRMEFPDLKAYVKKHYDEWEPDVLMVEKKASGAPLIYELRTMGIPVSEYTPHRGTGDKMTRLNAISDLFASGKVWAPPTRWARDVIEEVASFPVAAHDDYVDCVSMAMLRVRQGGFIRTNLDEPDDVSYFKSSRKAAYY